MAPTITSRPSRLAQEALAANVLVLRARRRLSQTELAERAGISRATLSKIEGVAGDPSISVLDAIARTLGVSIAELFAGDCGDAPADHAELAALAAESHDEAVDARTLLAAVDEAAGHAPERYSRAGRPRLAR